MTIRYRGMRSASITCTLKDMAKQGDILGMCGCVGGSRVDSDSLEDSQATTMDPYFEASWLGYGHAFAAENDHDQAINAYLTCSKLIPG